jgi:hypothetical protein
LFIIKTGCMKTIFENSDILIRVNDNETFHTNKQAGITLRFHNNRNYISITYDNNELIPCSTNGLPTVKIIPRKS